jgi:broad specificity phosphatase PhoE
MTLPITFTLVRHGRSEANVIQERLKSNGVVADIPAGLFDRHDANMRLYSEGVDQAEAAGRWLHEHGPAFDRFYTSPHTRTRETAAHLHLDGAWRVDDRFRERDWGEVHYITETGEDPLSAASKHSRQLSRFYWKPQAGESLATGVRLRVESILSSLYRKEGINHVIAVTHGEFISACQFVIERMTPDQWEKMDRDPNYKVQNAMIIQYTRQDPFGKPTRSKRFPWRKEMPLSKHFKWRRAICPWDESLSWNGGQWEPILFHKFGDNELLTSVEEYKPLL